LSTINTITAGIRTLRYQIVRELGVQNLGNRGARLRSFANHNELTGSSRPTIELLGLVTAKARQNPELFQKVAALLHNIGVENPYDLTEPSLVSHVNLLISSYQDYHQGDKLKQALVLFCSVFHPVKGENLSKALVKRLAMNLPGSIKINGQESPFSFIEQEFSCYRYRGLSEAEGGLEIYYSEDPNTIERKKHGNLLPKELIAANLKDRFAACSEMSNLLICLLRIAGIQAEYNLVRDETHVNVLVTIKDEYFIFDPAEGTLQRSGKKPATVVSDAIGLTKHYANEGYFRAAQDNLNEAISVLGVIVECGENDAVTLNNLGIALASRNQAGDLDLARKCFIAARKIRPEYQAAQENLILTLIRLDRIDEAEAIIAKARQNNPGDAFALCCAAKISIIKKKVEQATEILLQAIDSNPEQTIDFLETIPENSRDYFVWYLLGVAYQTNNQTALAIRSLTNSVDKNPRHLSSWSGLINLYFKNKQPLKGLASLVKCCYHVILSIGRTNQATMLSSFLASQ